MSKFEDILEDIKNKARASWEGPIGEERAGQIETFLRIRIKEYSERLKISQETILEQMEKRRTYSVENYYQPANFPSLEKITVFETMDEYIEKYPSRKHTCPSCGEVGDKNTECDKCGWKSWGLLKNLGKGFEFVIKEDFLERPVVYDIFQPIENKEEK